MTDVVIMPDGVIILDLNENTKTVSVKMKKETVELIDDICRKHGITRSRFIREAVKYFLREKFGIDTVSV